METEQVEYVTFPAQDGFQLTGTAYWPDETNANGDAVLIAAATGVKRGYYHKFAHFLRDRGFKVLTFDYRGSAIRALKTSSASRRTWLSGASTIFRAPWTGSKNTSSPTAF